MGCVLALPNGFNSLDAVIKKRKKTTRLNNISYITDYHETIVVLLHGQKIRRRIEWENRIFNV